MNILFKILSNFFNPFKFLLYNLIFYGKSLTLKNQDLSILHPNNMLT